MLNTAATPALIRELKADAVIVATGAERSARPSPAPSRTTCGPATNCAA
jgi:hypothetical protein